MGAESPRAGPLVSSRLIYLSEGRNLRKMPETGRENLEGREWGWEPPQEDAVPKRENQSRPANVASRFPKCLAAVSTAFAEVERLLSAGPPTQAVLREELGACGSLDLIEDQAELLGALQALVGGTVQYDGQAGAPLSVRQLCGLLLGNWGNRSHSTPYLGLRRAVQVSHPDASVSQRLTDQGCAPAFTELRQPKPSSSP